MDFVSASVLNLETRQGRIKQMDTSPGASWGRHGQVLSRCSGGWLEAPSRDVLLFQGLVIRVTCVLRTVAVGVFTLLPPLAETRPLAPHSSCLPLHP